MTFLLFFFGVASDHASTDIIKAIVSLINQDNEIMVIMTGKKKQQYILGKRHDIPINVDRIIQISSF